MEAPKLCKHCGGKLPSRYGQRPLAFYEIGRAKREFCYCNGTETGVVAKIVCPKCNVDLESFIQKVLEERGGWCL